MNQKRIWEIDALRGFLILCVILSHTLYYSSNILGLFRIPPLIRYVMQYGGALFVILSGLSSTLGSNGFRRGLFVFAGGMVLTAGSYAGVLLGWLGDDMIIRFGVLHLLGFAMMLSPLLKKLPSWLLCVFGLAVVVVGYWLEAQPALVETRLLFPLGLRFPGFTSGDYFPMAPHLGWFCLGIVLGRLLYREKKTRFPGVSDSNPFVRFFCFCGRNSLYIFIIHLPIVGLLMMLISSQL
ncbi:MAG: heparan-alpha-glucosaminide N-acetyltransferase [Candidatus Faecousia sp.]|nr:heparan-alpha-glucosaminide N-acetyltransferase [Candidatus Faecousia sp.]